MHSLDDMTYVLDDQNRPVKATFEQSVYWKAENFDRCIVEKTTYEEQEVSTVFLGMDYNWTGEGPPILFETMIFGGKYENWAIRCATWKEALLQHKRAVWMVRGVEAEGETG